MPDVSFEHLIDHYKNKIQQGIKGDIRAEISKYHILNHTSLDQVKNLRIADLGAGLGDFSLWFESLGHQVFYNDISPAMVHNASLCFGKDSSIEILSGPFQQLNLIDLDVIHIQAVLEWLEDPEAGFNCAINMLKPGGTLVLSFFNLESLIVKNLFKGNYYKVDSGQFGGDGKGLTPINPLDKKSVLTWIQKNNLNIINMAGLRSFVDYVNPTVPVKERLLDIVRLEKELSGREPYISMARYIQVICVKPE